VRGQRIVDPELQCLVGFRDQFRIAVAAARRRAHRLHLVVQVLEVQRIDLGSSQVLDTVDPRLVADDQPSAANRAQMALQGGEHPGLSVHRFTELRRGAAVLQVKG
jgi:hypothetical protein